MQYFNQTQLHTHRGENIQVIDPGIWNHNQGPDFTDARIKIDNTLLAGSVEIHLKTSQWDEHGHDMDSNYSNVILHVVFDHDTVESKLPVLELQSLISKILLDRYTHLMNSSSFIACATSISGIKSITLQSWKERLLAERLQRKADQIFYFLKETNYNWEEVFWWRLARNFGSKVNADAFESVARSIPLSILSKHRTVIHQLEGLLLGQAGLLNSEFRDDYARLLQREFIFLKKKYKLRPVPVPVHFLRMRPGNFPTIRLVQLAALIMNSSHLFSGILDAKDINDLKKNFEVTANDYWLYHYRFDELSEFRKKAVGKDMIDNLMINTIIPVLFAYGCYHNEEIYKMKAVQWLEKLGAENNTIIKGFERLEIFCHSAFDSQALIELKTNYCNEKKCLSCAIGNAVLKQ